MYDKCIRASYFWSITRGGLWWEGSLNGGTTHYCMYIIASEASFLVSSMARIFSLSIYIYMFQAVRRAVNVLNVSTCI